MSAGQYSSGRVGKLLRFLASCLLAFPCIAQSAGTIPGDVTGIWFDANHPGWGMGLVQQNDAVLATLFVYDTSGAPVWYVASRLESHGVNFDPCGTMPLTGTLYRAQWPSFGSAANPQGSMQVQTVGTLTVTVPTAPDASSLGCDLNGAAVQYSIDGVQSTVTVTRETWSTNQARLYAQFAGGLVFSAPASSLCQDLSSLLPFGGRQFSINGSADDANPIGVRLVWGTGSDTACEIRGTYSQGGELGAVSGTLSCGPIGFSLGPGAPIRLSSLYVGDSGFVAAVALDINSCHYLGTLSGARRP
jgi:hypothetical protein